MCLCTCLRAWDSFLFASFLCSIVWPDYTNWAFTSASPQTWISIMCCSPFYVRRTNSHVHFQCITVCVSKMTYSTILCTFYWLNISILNKINTSLNISHGLLCVVITILYCDVDTEMCTHSLKYLFPFTSPLTIWIDCVY